MTIICNSALEAIQAIKSNQYVWVHSMAATPTLLLNALVQQAPQLHNVQLLQLHLENAEMLCSESLDGHLRNRCFFAGRSMRELINQGRADYVPIFLSEIPKLLRSNRQPVDVAMIQVSPPDAHGNCSLGVSVEATLAAVNVAKTVIAHINPQMPRTHGDAIIPYKQLDYVYQEEQALPCCEPPTLSELHQRIGQHVSELIDDGDCLQMGIGAIPDAVLANLHQHRDLGVHTEMFSDGLLPLIDKGVVNNRRKKIHAGRTVTGFVLGSARLYEFVDDNPLVSFLDIEYVNNPAVIRKNKNVVSINSAIQVDLSGQVCADSMGSKIYSGVGGQVDFVTGSQLSEGGKSIIALPSTAVKGSVSRIVGTLSKGAGVVTTRAHVDHIVTEYGIASLQGYSLKERAQKLVEIAHPDFRQALSEAAGL